MTNRIVCIKEKKFWLSSKADEIQSFADRKCMKKFPETIKAIYGPHTSGITPLLNAGGHISVI